MESLYLICGVVAWVVSLVYLWVMFNLSKEGQTFEDWLAKRIPVIATTAIVVFISWTLMRTMTLEMKIAFVCVMAAYTLALVGGKHFGRTGEKPESSIRG